MKHLESAFAGKNTFWRYLVMFAAVLLASNTIGAIPIFFSMAVKASSDPEVISKLAAHPNDLSILVDNPNTGLLMMLFPFLVGLATLVLLFKPLHHRTILTSINGTGGIRWNRIFVSAFIWIVFSALYLLIYMKFDPSDFSLNNGSATLYSLIIISLLLIPFQSSFEEILFRGYLMQGFAVLSRSRWFPLLFTSLFFGFMHAWNPEIKEYGFITMMPQYVLFGLLFGLMTILDDGIEIALGAHAANNIFLSIMVTNSSSTLQTPALYEQHTVYPWTEFGALIVVSVLFFFVMKAIYRWNSISVLWKNIIPEEEEGQVS
jgi:membrane protease YdiL (CAAX protease family)